MGAGVTEEDFVIILKREIADELKLIGLDLSSQEKINEFRDDLVYLRKTRTWDTKREDVVKKTLLALLITAAAYAVFQGVRFYILNGLPPAAQPQKVGVLYEHPTSPPAAYVALDRPHAADAVGHIGAVAAATAG